jgi:hypothetical protein
MLGIDPKSELTDLLMRAKYFLETGREPHDAVARRRHRSDPRNGSQKRSAQKKAELQGPGAPTDDVQSTVAFEPPRSPWPPASEPTIRPVSAAGPFPPAID